MPTSNTKLSVSAPTLQRTLEMLLYAINVIDIDQAPPLVVNMHCEQHGIVREILSYLEDDGFCFALETSPDEYDHASFLRLQSRFVASYRTTKTYRTLPLPTQAIRTGALIAEQQGLALKDKVVCFEIQHQLNFHNAYHDCFFDNFYPALRYLSDEGFQIIRLPDGGRTSYHDLFSNYLESPATDARLNLYLLTQSTFVLSGQSKDFADFARLFGIPTLRTNCVFRWGLWGTRNDLFHFKLFYYRPLNRCLSLREIASSAALFEDNPQCHDQDSIDLVEATAQTLVKLVAEMLELLETKEHRSTSVPLEALEDILHGSCHPTPNAIEADERAGLLGGGRIAATFIEQQPGFLGFQPTDNRKLAQGLRHA